MWCRLLAVLLSEANRPVPVDSLIDALWNGKPPRSARKGLQVYVHRLRHTLGSADRIGYGRNGYSIRGRDVGTGRDEVHGPRGAGTCRPAQG
ncbi:AfsR/SARP family transcriptional regulator [Nonomuraea sp. NPDC003201]